MVLLKQKKAVKKFNISWSALHRWMCKGKLAKYRTAGGIGVELRYF